MNQTFFEEEEDGSVFFFFLFSIFLKANKISEMLTGKLQVEQWDLS